MVLLFLMALIIALLLALLLLPVEYEGQLYLGRPFRLHGYLSVGKNLFHASWSYTEGEEPACTSQAFWQKKKSSPAPAAPPTPAETEKAWQELEKESQQTTYDEVKDATPAPKTAAAEPETKTAPPKAKMKKSQLFSLLFHEDFLAAFFTCLGRLFQEGQIRNFTLSGELGLAQPHETGILSGLLYAFCPGSVDELAFNFVEEKYDCLLRASGRLYPGIVLVIIGRFVTAPPVRRLFSSIHTAKKGDNHGYSEHQK